MAIDPKRVKEIFLEAAELSDEAARSAYLERACDGDAELRERIEALLRSHDPEGSFLGTPAAVVPDPAHAATRDYTPDHTPGGTSDGGAGASNDESLTFLAPSTRPDSLGRLGHYEMLQVLGKGGFGIVFRAFDDILQRVVAVKVMAPQMATLSPARKRFLREARSSAQVRHENVVQVHEVGEQPLPHLVMEFIPGETLQQRLNRTGPLDVPEVLRIGRQIAEGLAAAHACDLIHRDIKPGNILLEGGSHKVKITDFGLARAADDASISQSGVVAGTPMFMAPEQALGHKIDQRADLFSLGSVLYQMASGRPPFRAQGALAVLKRVAEESPRPIPEIIPETPAWLCAIIGKLHAKNPDERYQSAREVADVLTDCEAQLKANSKLQDFSRIPPGKPAVRRSSRWVWAVALVPILAGVAVIALRWPHLFGGHQATPVNVPTLGTKNELPPLADGWVRLFNGKDLSGWKTHDLAPGNWRVEDGAIVGRGDKSFLSFLFSESEYADFHLRVEAKINAIGDSGVFFRAPFDVRLLDGGPKYSLPGGYEAQIAVRSNYRAHTGSLFWDEPPFTQPPFYQQGPLMPHRPDEWFVLEVIAQGNRIQTFVNGKKTVDYVDEQRRYDRGHLALQTWGWNITFVQFRKIEIKELPPAASPLPPTFKNSIGMEFVIVPKGKSWLGGSKDKLGNKEVVIPADFYLGKYEVTQEEWTQVMGYNTSAFSRKGGFKDAVKDITDGDLKRFPVEQVSWDQCQIFVTKLNRIENERGWDYRLPTEEEWEYACRGGPMADKRDSAFDFYCAKPTNTLLPEQANFNNGSQRPAKVGSYAPNVLGLYDMHGNVGEWCNDPHWVVRGGGWGGAPSDCRAESSSGVIDGIGSVHYGLRLVRVQIGTPAPEAKTPPLAVAPFDAAQAKKHQEDWAKHLGVPIEIGPTAQGYKLRLIPPGTFRMGADPGDDRAGRNERPQHEVTITRPFYLSTLEVTQGQFRRFVQETGYTTKAEVGDRGTWRPMPGPRGAGTVFGPKRGINWKNRPDKTQTDDYPVSCLAWEDAVAYCAWLSKKEGKVCRLPTEAEWEYACRAGTTSSYSFGEVMDKQHANLAPEYRKLLQVGSLTPNPFGLYDMHGNIAEWCLDAPRSYGPASATDPVGTGNHRVYRGGDWFGSILYGRSFARHFTPSDLPPEYTAANVPIVNNGFRVLFELPSNPTTAVGKQ